jgi:uncharacterized protein (DUF169 family)
MPSKDWAQLSKQLAKVLGLQHAPIAISFSQAAPAGVGAYQGDMPEPSGDGRTGKVPAGCVFWIKAENQTFTTIPEDHYNCSVGSVTHGLKSLADVMQNEDVQGILAAEWVTPEEAMQLPAVQERPNYITYGPLADTPIDPDVVLLRINAFQGMVIHDGFGEMPVVGKPQCHIIPLAKEQDQIAMSTGCMLSRIRTGMSPDEMTCTIPAARLEEVIDRLEARRQANAAVAAYANQDKRRFAQG